MLPSPLTHAAVIYNGETFSRPAPARHYDVLIDAVVKYNTPIDQSEVTLGFLDADGDFLSRTEAMTRAKMTQQLTSALNAQTTYPELISSDIW